MSLSDCFSSDDLVNVALALTLQRKKKQKSRWCKPWLLKRDSLSHEGLLNKLRLEPVDYFNYVQMDEQTYSKLSSLLTPLIKRQDTVMPKAISPHGLRYGTATSRENIEHVGYYGSVQLRKPKKAPLTLH